MLTLTFEFQTTQALQDFLRKVDAPDAPTRIEDPLRDPEGDKESDIPNMNGTVKSYLVKLKVPRDNWKLIPRTGKNDKLLKSDVDAWYKSSADDDEPDDEDDLDENDASEDEDDEDDLDPWEEEDTAVEPTVTKAECQAALRAVYDTHNQDTELCQGILSRFGCKSLKELEEVNYPKFLKACAEAQKTGKA